MNGKKGRNKRMKKGKEQKYEERERKEKERIMGGKKEIQINEGRKDGRTEFFKLI